MPTTTPTLRDALTDALRALTGTRAYVEQTGGGCEAIMVGPLDTGAWLWITDGDAGLPTTTDPRACHYCAGEDVECDHGFRGWLVTVAPHSPDVECDRCGDCFALAPYVDDETAPYSADGLLSVVTRALRGENHN